VPLPIELETYRALVDEFGGDLAPSAAGGGLCADAEEAEAAAEAAEAAEEAAEAEEDAAEAAEAAEEEVAAEAAEEGEGGDALHEGGVKTTAERVGLLKAIELRSADSWLHRRLCALRYAAAAAATSPAAPARKLVVFAHHVRVMDCLEATVRAALGPGFRCVRVDGSCAGVAKTALLDQFRDDRATLVALCSIRACGQGTDGMHQP